MLMKKIKNLFKKNETSHLSEIIQQPIQIQDLKDFVIDWNTNFPIDRWWRKKYKIAFNSPEHREVSFLDMRIEWEEDILFEKIRKDDKYTLNSGDFMKDDRSMKDDKPETELQNEFEQEFKNMDLSQFDEI